MRKIILAASLICAPGLAQAQSGCTTYTGTTTDE
jgi:hypothetical protein